VGHAGEAGLLSIIAKGPFLEETFGDRYGYEREVLDLRFRFSALRAEKPRTENRTMLPQAKSGAA
jgi:hypothetical protein